MVETATNEPRPAFVHLSHETAAGAVSGVDAVAVAGAGAASHACSFSC